MNSKSFVWPKVSLVLLTYNGERSVLRTLRSLKKLTYPKAKLEIIISDNNSSDKTIELVKKYFRKVFVSDVELYAHRAEAMRRSSGDFIYMILEQDMEIKSVDFVQKMVRPLLEDSTLSGSFTREYPRIDQPWITRFLSYDPMQRDPLFEFLTPSIEDSVSDKRKGYFVCDYSKGKIPPATHMLFRKSFLKKAGVWSQSRDFDHDTVLKLVGADYDHFAYVPSAGIFHYHVDNLKELVAKRRRNLQNHFFPQYESLSYRWVDPLSRIEILRLILFVMYANLFLPAMLRGIYRFFKFRDWVLLMEPIVTFVVTDMVLIEFLRSATGRKVILRFVRNCFVNKNSNTYV